jgi:thiol-disulfide isomerase/thioredoxin
MGKASRAKGDDDRRARIAAQREAARRAEQRKRIYLAGGSILAVAIVVVAFVLVKLNSNSNSSASAPTGAALTSVTNKVTNIPVSVTDKVADGGVSKGIFVSASTSDAVKSAANNLGSYMATVNGTSLTSGGKPEVLFIGGEYCPYCAAERWAMVNAFSRFGTFTGLKTTHSSSTDVYPNTPTFTFVGSKYTSKYITFTPVEEFGSSNSDIIQNPTSAQQALATSYDPGGAIPFIDLGNKYAEVGNLSPLSPGMLAGKTWAQVSAAMNDPTSSLGKALVGNANYLTASTCVLTGNQPSTACTPAIQKLEANLAK